MTQFNIVKLPTDNRLHQGMIFTGAIAEEYTECQVYGLIITARCDIAQNKVEIYNYLPIVSLSDWITYDLYKIIIPAIEKTIRNNMKNVLVALNLSPAILNTVNPRIVYERIVMETSNTKQQDSFHKNLIHLEKIDSLSSNFNKYSFIEIVNSHLKIRDEFLSKLVKQVLNGYYFIPGVDATTDNSGYVVLLREIRGLSKELAMKLADGLTELDYKQLVGTNILHANKMSFTSLDYAMPISQMLSPYIEHLMQSFGNTFCRIGITDIDEPYIASLSNTHFVVNNLGAL